MDLSWIPDNMASGFPVELRGQVHQLQLVVPPPRKVAIGQPFVVVAFIAPNDGDTIPYFLDNVFGDAFHRIGVAPQNDIWPQPLSSAEKELTQIARYMAFGQKISENRRRLPGTYLMFRLQCTRPGKGPLRIEAWWPLAADLTSRGYLDTGTVETVDMPPPQVFNLSVRALLDEILPDWEKHLLGIEREEDNRGNVNLEGGSPEGLEEYNPEEYNPQGTARDDDPQATMMQASYPQGRLPDSNPQVPEQDVGAWPVWGV
ncbi:hypothetical protein HD806DRAFT_532939 [Xylariaceae sp. AK1471]|nr:hypothetical protein HD806DRAFT_532939 [Xylariaceae sp. AK1471]